MPSRKPAAASCQKRLSWSELVDELLCVGWIEGQSKGIDEERFAQRITPRKPGSNWSRVNIAKVAELLGSPLRRICRRR